MTEEKKKPGRPKIYKAKVSGKISNGQGGYFKEGDTLPDSADIQSLQDKGLV